MEDVITLKLIADKDLDKVTLYSGTSLDDNAEVHGVLVRNTSDVVMLDSANYEILPGELYIAGLKEDIKNKTIVEVYRWAVDASSLKQYKE